jgi:hypothetical protein
MTYVEKRIVPRLKWYDARAITCKRTHVFVEVGTSVLSIVLVLLIDVEVVPRFALATIAALVAALIAIDRIGRFGEKWLLYRLAAEALESEVQLHAHSAGPYAGEQANSEKLLAERVETLLQHEATGWRALSQPEETNLARKMEGA